MANNSYTTEARCHSYEAQGSENPSPEAAASFSSQWIAQIFGNEHAVSITKRQNLSISQ